MGDPDRGQSDLGEDAPGFHGQVRHRTVLYCDGGDLVRRPLVLVCHVGNAAFSHFVNASVGVRPDRCDQWRNFLSGAVVLTPNASSRSR